MQGPQSKNNKGGRSLIAVMARLVGGEIFLPVMHRICALLRTRDFAAHPQ